MLVSDFGTDKANGGVFGEGVGGAARCRRLRLSFADLSVSSLIRGVLAGGKCEKAGSDEEWEAVFHDICVLNREENFERPQRKSRVCNISYARNFASDFYFLLPLSARKVPFAKNKECGEVRSLR